MEEEEEEIDETVVLLSTEILEYLASSVARLESLDNALDKAQGEVLTEGKVKYQILIIVGR